MGDNGNSEGKVCGECVYWADLICRRYPPQVIVLIKPVKVMAANQPPVAQIPQSSQPLVPATYPACGEFKPRKKV